VETCRGEAQDSKQAPTRQATMDVTPFAADQKYKLYAAQVQFNVQENKMFRGRKLWLSLLELSPQ
jgi:hypothetical protein